MTTTTNWTLGTTGHQTLQWATSPNITQAKTSLQNTHLSTINEGLSYLTILNPEFVYTYILSNIEAYMYDVAMTNMDILYAQGGFGITAVGGADPKLQHFAMFNIIKESLKHVGNISTSTIWPENGTTHLTLKQVNAARVYAAIKAVQGYNIGIHILKVFEDNVKTAYFTNNKSRLEASIESEIAQSTDQTDRAQYTAIKNFISNTGGGGKIKENPSDIMIVLNAITTQFPQKLVGISIKSSIKGSAGVIGTICNWGRNSTLGHLEPVNPTWAVTCPNWREIKNPPTTMPAAFVQYCNKKYPLGTTVDHALYKTERARSITELTRVWAAKTEQLVNNLELMLQDGIPRDSSGNQHPLQPQQNTCTIIPEIKNWIGGATASERIKALFLELLHLQDNNLGYFYTFSNPKSTASFNYDLLKQIIVDTNSVMTFSKGNIKGTSIIVTFTINNPNLALKYFNGQPRATNTMNCKFKIWVKTGHDKHTKEGNVIPVVTSNKIHIALDKSFSKLLKTYFIAKNKDGKIGTGGGNLPKSGRKKVEDMDLKKMKGGMILPPGMKMQLRSGTTIDSANATHLKILCDKKIENLIGVFATLSGERVVDCSIDDESESCFYRTDFDTYIEEINDYEEEILGANGLEDIFTIEENENIEYTLNQTDQLEILSCRPVQQVGPEPYKQVLLTEAAQLLRTAPEITVTEQEVGTWTVAQLELKVKALRLLTQMGAKSDQEKLTIFNLDMTHLYEWVIWWQEQLLVHNREVAQKSLLYNQIIMMLGSIFPPGFFSNTELVEKIKSELNNMNSTQLKLRVDALTLLNNSLVVAELSLAQKFNFFTEEENLLENAVILLKEKQELYEQAIQKGPAQNHVVTRHEQTAYLLDVRQQLLQQYAEQQEIYKQAVLQQQHGISYGGSKRNKSKRNKRNKRNKRLKSKRLKSKRLKSKRNKSKINKYKRTRKVRKNKKNKIKKTKHNNNTKLIK